MDAEIDYAKMCAICPCRKRHLDGEEEPAKKRKEVESEEQESDGPAADNKEANNEDEDSKSEASLLITEFDSDEQPEEDDEREVEEEASECPANSSITQPSQTPLKRKSAGVCEQRPTRCVCIAARDRLVEALIPPSMPLGPYEREEMIVVRYVQATDRGSLSK